jgi:hypothetical protein
MPQTQMLARAERENIPARHPSLVPPSKIGCACRGCNFHVARLEEMNSQLAQECDRLRRENDSLGKAVAA